MLLMEIIPFGGNHSFYWKPLLLVEIVPFDGNDLFK